MKCRTSILATIALLSLLAAPAGAQMIDTPAQHAVILDNTTGEILFSKDGAEPMIPASMTKMMTAYLVFDMVKRGELKMTDGPCAEGYADDRRAAPRRDHHVGQ